MNSEKKAKISLALKQNKLVRLLSYPYVNYKRKRIKQIFHDSEDGAYLRTLKNKFAGKRCFIVGNGPSLTIDDLNQLKDEYAFGANKILYLLDKTVWVPTFYLCQDIEACYMIEDKLKECDIPYKFINVECKKHSDSKQVHYIYPYVRFSLNKYNPSSAYFSEDISSCICPGYTVTFASIQMAAYMGFKEIYLLGVDHNYAMTIDRKGHVTKDDSVQTYAAGIPDWGKSMQSAEVTTESYQCAKEYCDTHGIKICNATRGGKLEVFERVDFDSLFK